MKLGIIGAIVASLFGCSKKPDISDGPGMEYHDSDYRSEYSQVLDFESFGKDVYFACEFFGSGSEGEEESAKTVEKLFSHLPENVKSNIKRFDFGGENWYLVIPRYRDYCNIKSLAKEREYTAYNGEAFLVRCDENSVEISIDSNGGQRFILGAPSENVADLAQM